MLILAGAPADAVELKLSWFSNPLGAHTSFLFCGLPLPLVFVFVFRRGGRRSARKTRSKIREIDGASEMMTALRSRSSYSVYPGSDGCAAYEVWVGGHGGCHW